MKKWGPPLDEDDPEDDFNVPLPPPHGPPPSLGPNPPHPPPPPHEPPPPARDMLTPLVTKALILRILKEKPAHGYEISDRISFILGRKIARSRIYTLLNILELQGFVYSRWEVVDGKARRIYYITDEGERFFEATKNRLKALKNVLDYIYS